jgi:uncharacterized protein (TIGR03084 family)
MPADIRALCADLADEHEELDAIVSSRATFDWDVPTPAEGWAVRDQIAHLLYFDHRAELAITDPSAFAAHLQRYAAVDLAEFDDDHLRPQRDLPAAQLLAEWREGRTRMLNVFALLDAKQRIVWYGPDMSAASFVTARLMETWTHGQDVADALGVVRAPTHRLRHIAHLGVRARAFNYASHGRALPAQDVSVELREPDGGYWRWGDPQTRDRVEGDLLDFCLVVTQRRHALDTGLKVTGAGAKEWMSIAQAYAGPPGPGRRPGQFSR